MFLLDTNIILELLLDQEKADDVEQFLHNTSHEKLFLSEFTLYSLGNILIRRRMHDTFMQSISDLLISGGIKVLRLDIEDMHKIVHASTKFKLDFDDAYQYVTAENFNLTLVSFDKDFEHTVRGRKTPSEILRKPLNP